MAATGWGRLVGTALMAAPLPTLRAADYDQLELLQVIELKADLHHVQGIDIDANHLWVTSVDAPSRKGFLHEFRIPGGELIRYVEVQDGVRFHPGGIAADANSLWLPVAEYRRNSSAVVQKRSKRTLSLEYQFEVPDHIGCIAVSPSLLVGGNWDSRDLYVWDHHGKFDQKLANPGNNAYQDMKFDGDTLIASGLLRGGGGGAIDWLAFPSLRQLRRIVVDRTDRGKPYTQEGMTICKGLVYLLPEDGPSRLFVFRMKR